LKSIVGRLFKFDSNEAMKTPGLIAGVDEAGRGPLAGPVVAAAVILPRRYNFRFLNDSKQVTPARREVLFRQIAGSGLVGIGIVDEKVIDKINIYQATRLAMRQAVLALTRTPDMLLVDGNMTLDLPLLQKSVIKGDEKSAAIAAASIIAKVCRDAWMTHLETIYPSYRFSAHKGYGTREHIETIRRIGPTPVHRFSFGPVQNPNLVVETGEIE